MMGQLLRVSFSTGLVVLVLMGFFRGTRQRYGATLKYWVWLFVALRLMVPVTVTLPQAATSVPVIQTVAQAQQRITQRVTESEKQGQQEDTAEISYAAEVQAPKSLNMEALVITVWAMGCGCFLLYHLLADLTFRRYVRRWGRPVTNREVRGLVANARKNGKIRGTLGLLVLKEAGSPMVMGLWHPVLILPHEEWDSTELYYVLRHEMTHLRRRDSLYKLVLLLCNGVHWFNPLVWLLRVRANQDLEIACDLEVVAGATRSVRMQYCETIMATAQRSAMAGVSTFGSTKKSIMERFREIFAGEKRRKGTVVLAMVVLLGVLCGATVAVGTVEQKDEPEKTVVVQNINFTPQITVPESLQTYIFTDSQEYLFYCKKEEQILWAVYQTDFSGIRQVYDLPLDHWDDDYELTHALDATTWILGTEPYQNARNYSDAVWCISVFGAETLAGCQELLYQFLLDNGITPNPYCMAEPYYMAPGAEENLENHYDLYDPERIYPAALKRLEQVNEIGLEQEILESFAQFLARDSDRYRRMAELTWYLGYNSAGIPVFAASGICELGYSYDSLWYQNGEAVYGYQYGFDDPESVEEAWEIVE